MTQTTIQIHKGAWDQLQYGIHTTNETSVAGFGLRYYMPPDGESVIFLGADNKLERFTLNIPHDPHSLGDLIGTFQLTAEFAGIDFNNDGTIMIILHDDTREILQYTVPTPYDFTSIVDAPVSFDTTQVTLNEPSTVRYSRDGDFVFFSDLTDLFSLPLSIPFDVTSFVTSSDTSFPFTGIDVIQSFVFKPEGDKIYTLDLFINEVVEYTLTPYDITTMVKTGNALPVSDFSAPSDISFRHNGDQFFVFFVTSGKFVRYHLDDSWEIDVASHFGNDTPLLSGSANGLDVKPDGKKFYITAAGEIIEYSTPFSGNSSKMTKNGNTFNVVFLGGVAMELQWSNDGNHCYYVTDNPHAVHQLDATVPHDSSTLSHNGVSFFPTEGGLLKLEGFFILPDEKKFYILFTNFVSITGVFEYDMPTKGDLVNTVYSGNTKNVHSTTKDIRAMTMKPDGSQLFIFSRSGSGTVHRFIFGIDKNASTIKFVDELFMDEVDTLILGIHMEQDDGSKLYSHGLLSNQMHEHDISLEFNNSIINELGDTIVNEEGGIVVSA